MNCESFQNILAFAPNWLGDAAMCTPAFRALRRRFPEARFTVAGRDNICCLLEGLPWIDGFETLSKRPGAGTTLREGWRLRRGGYDLCAVFPHSIRAALLARMTGARARIGYRRDRRGWLLTRAVEPYCENGRITPIYMAREYLGMIAPLGCEDDGQGLELHADAREVNIVRARLRTAAGDVGRPVAGIAPGAAFGPSKQWPVERFAAVADGLAAQTGAQIVLLTGPGEEETRAAFLRAARTPVAECYDAQPTLARLKAIIASLDVLICNDSGPRHLAVAFRRPVICVMGSTSPAYTQSPWEIGEVIRVDVDCGPCQKPVCATDHRCMTRIAPERVLASALRWLASGL